MTWIVFLGCHLKKVWFHKVNQRYWNVGCRLIGWISTILAAFIFLNNILLCMTDRQCHTITVDVTQCSKMPDLIRKFENGQVSDIQLFSFWYLIPVRANLLCTFQCETPCINLPLCYTVRIFFVCKPELESKVHQGANNFECATKNCFRLKNFCLIF